MTAAPQRRRFRFSLRTMFVAVTAAACWLGWQRHIVEDRKFLVGQIEADFEAQAATLNEIDEIDGRETPAFPFILGYQEGVFTSDLRLGNIEYTRISLVRRLLGDDPYLSLNLSPTLPTQIVRRVEQAFPEARLFMHDPERYSDYAFRDALLRPAALREPNVGTVFTTGIIEK